MGVIKKSLNEIYKYLILLLNFLFSIMLILAIFQVISRYVINYSLPWTEEISRYIFIWIVMLGSAVLVREKAQVAITLFRDMLQGKIKHALEIIVTIISMFFLSILFYQGTLIAIKLSHQVSPAAEIPMSLVYASISIGPLLMLIFYFEILIGIIKNWIKKEEV